MKRRRPPASARGGAIAEINITPMVDVLLCLLILVMVIQPGLLKGLDLQVPPPDAGSSAPAAAPDQIILAVGPGPVYSINHQTVSAPDLAAGIAAAFRGRARKVLFVQGAEDASYEDVVTAVDVARGAGIRVVGLVPRPPAPRAVVPLATR